MAELKKRMGVKVVGAGRSLPDMVATNEDFAKIVDTSDEWITQRTGIKTRRISNGEPNFYYGGRAAMAALEDAGLTPKDVDLIICSTVTPDFYTPSESCLIQREIGAEGCMCIDINCACTGFDYGFDMARRYLLAEDDVDTVLLIACEELSKFVDYTDRASCILFGDGSAAFVLQRQPDTLYASYLGADGSGAPFLVARALKADNVFRTREEEFDMQMPQSKEHYLYQDGKEVYKFATRAMPNAVLKACEKAGITPEELDVIVPHQANVRIIETAAKNLGVSMDKMAVYIDRYGNTSSSSIPIAFCDALAEGRIKRGDKVCLVGFGGGLTYAAIIFEY